MHSWIRRLHLASALVLLAFVAMYFVTGYVMTRAPWFGKSKDESSERSVVLDPAAAGTPTNTQAYVEALQATLSIPGRHMTSRPQGASGWQYQFHKPDLATTVTVSPDGRTARVRELRPGWQRVMSGLHRVHGYHGGVRYVVWSVLYDLSSASMIVFALTGLWLWHGSTRRHGPGWAVLLAGAVFTTATVAYLLMRR